MKKKKPISVPLTVELSVFCAFNDKRLYISTFTGDQPSVKELETLANDILDYTKKMKNKK